MKRLEDHFDILRLRLVGDPDWESDFSRQYTRPWDRKWARLSFGGLRADWIAELIQEILADYIHHFDIHFAQFWL